MSRSITRFVKAAKKRIVSRRHLSLSLRSIDKMATYVALVIVMAAIALFAAQSHFKGISRALAFMTTSQSDWSNGQGTDPTNQYEDSQNVTTSTPSQLTVTSTTVNGWCATAHCDTSWLYRKQVYRTNYGQSASKRVRMHITYDTKMNADFSDLRFVTEDGQTEFDYWVTSKTNSVQADIVLAIPDAGNLNSLMVYFGNAAADSRSDSSLAVFEQTHFESGAVDSPYYIDNESDTIDPYIDNGTLKIAKGRISGDYYPRDFTRVYESQFRLNYTGSACGFMADANGDSEAIFAPRSLSYMEVVQGTCQPQPSFSLWGVAGHDAIVYQPNAPELHSGDWIYMREITFNTGGSELYISYDEGANYIKLDNGPRDYNQNNSSSYQLSNEDSVLPETLEIRSLKGYIAADDGPVHGEWRYEDTASAQLEYQSGGIGYLTSAPVCVGTCQSNYFGTISSQFTGDGEVKFKVRSGPDAQMQGATGWAQCPLLQSGDEVTSSTCVIPGHAYIQYQIYLSAPSSLGLTVSSVNIEYDTDTTLPSGASNLVLRSTQAGQPVSNGSWMAINDNTAPYATWSAATDNVGGSGIGGYCIYLGTDQDADPTITSGIIGDGQQLGRNLCQYEVATPYLDADSYNYNLQQYNGQTLYFKVIAFDRSGNISTSQVETSVRIDSEAPSGFILASGPTGTINTKTFTVNYEPFDAIEPVQDGESGIAGVKYCIANFSTGFDCMSSSNDYQRGEWYGASHGSGRFDDQTDVLPLNAGSFTTTSADFDRIDSAGSNIVVMSLIDNAGNARLATPITLLVSISVQPPSAPLNLTVNPDISPGNTFSFHWDAPTTYSGPTNQITYCWSVNAPVNSDASNCTWTDPGVTSLPEGPYATTQGTNTLYLIAKDQSGNIESANNAHVTFITNTSAPGAPQDLDATDISTRATSNWKLAMSWAPPLAGAGTVTQYKILRSSGGQNYSVVGSTNTSNLSFIDTGLAQVLYSYKIQACDNAGACSVYSNVATAKPTGRYTSAATLVTQPTETDIATRKATITWTTDRDSDSRVAIGLASGTYFHDETGNSTQSPDHKLNLTGLQSNTRYYYVAKWTDVDGNTGVSAERSFMTAPAPVVSDVSVNGVNISSASVTFAVEHASGVKLTFGQSESMGGVKQINTSQNNSSYTLQLDELADGTKYFYRINGLDIDGNEYQGNIFSFTTLARPKITDLKLSAVADEPSSTQRVTWKTNVPTSTELVYGPQNSTQVEQIVSNPSIDHEMIVRGLIDDSDYTLVARVRDAVGNIGTSEIQRFHTALDTRPPKVNEISVETQVKGLGKEARGQVIVSWHTDEPATSQVAFGLGSGTGYGSLTAEDTRLTTEHVVVISDLPTSSVYQLKAVSRDKATNEGNSDNQSAIVGRGSENVFTIIFSALQSIFGIK